MPSAHQTRPDDAGGLRALMAVVAAGLLGWVLGYAAADAVSPEGIGESFHGFLLVPTAIAPLVLSAAGLLLGMFVAFAVIGHTRGYEHCPRCGSRNLLDARACSACDLRLR